jgi:hypothetical protein
VSGRSEGYRNVKTWLESGNRARKMYSCIVFYEKPIQFLSTGRTSEKENKPAKGDGVKVENNVLDYLPVHTDATLTDLAARTDTKYGTFKKVNFSMVRRVALLAIQKGWLQHERIEEWKNCYGGIPTQITYTATSWDKMSDETLRIKKMGIQQFVEDRTHWDGLTLNAP